MTQTAAARVTEQEIPLEALAPAAPWRSRPAASLALMLFALLVSRLLEQIPVPGIDPAGFRHLLEEDPYGRFAILRRSLSLGALGVRPYAAAWILVQLVAVAMPARAGSARADLSRYTLVLTSVLAMVQSYGMAVAIEALPGSPVVIDPGLGFRLVACLTMTACTLFLAWLGERITARGLANGVLSIILGDIVTGLPNAGVDLFTLARVGVIPDATIIRYVIVVLVTVAGVVCVERARYRFVVQYPKREVAGTIYGGERASIQIRCNGPGIVPAFIAGWLVPAAFAFDPSGGGWRGAGQPIAAIGPLQFLSYFSLFVLSALLLSAAPANPAVLAEAIRKRGGFIPGIRPGPNTATHLRRIGIALCLPSAAALALLSVLPWLSVTGALFPPSLAGSGIVIVAIILLDTLSRFRAGAWRAAEE
jgi:preprotein translocase subunit SecY